MLLRKMKWDELVHEYDVDATRLLPWDGMEPPFGGAWAVVRAGTTSKGHVNEPADEEELFICVSGRARVILGEKSLAVEKGDLVFIPAGVYHYIENPADTDFHLYSIWWNRGDIARCLAARGEA